MTIAATSMLQKALTQLNAKAGTTSASSSGGSTPSASATSGSSTASGTSSPSGGTGTANAASSIGDRFLTLLVTQLKNQDPLNPMDNAQLTTQLAQISTVTGINTLNDTMSTLSASIGASQYLQASALVGHTVLVPGSKLELGSDGSGTSGGAGAFSLPSAADDVVVTIRDAGGSLVRTLDLGAQGTGAQIFGWDGKNDSGTVMASGVYTFAITATSGTASITATPLMAGHVDGVIAGTNGGATQLQLGRLGRVDMTQIQEIL